MAKKERGKIVSRRTRSVSTPYTRTKTAEAGPSHRQPAEPTPSGSGYELPNQGSYSNSPEPQSSTGTDSFVDNEPRPSGSGYGLPNQQNYQDSPKPQSTTATNSFVDNVSAEFYKSDGSINIQRMHNMRASLLESFTIPSCSPPAMTANMAVVLASCRRRRSVEKSGDSESPKKGSEDTKSGSIFSQKKVNLKRILEELENMPTPLSDAHKFPFARKYCSTSLAQFMVEEDSVQQKNMGQPVEGQNDNPAILSIFRKRHPTGQVSVCESTKELVTALNPLPSSIVPSSPTTRGGDGNARKIEEEEEDSVQQRSMDKPVERQISKNTRTTNFKEGNAHEQVHVCESTTEPVLAPNRLPSSSDAVSSQDNSESYLSSGRSTGGKMKRKKSVRFQYPVARICGDDDDDDAAAAADDDDGEVEEDSVQQKNMGQPLEGPNGNPTILSIFRKRHPTGQVSVCESTKELVTAPLNPLPSSIVPSSPMTRGGDGNAREVEEEDSVQQRNKDKPESTKEPVSTPYLPSSSVDIPSQTNSESCSSAECSTRRKKRKKSVRFQCPVVRICGDDDDDGDDDGEKKRVKLETNISLPIPKIPKVTSTQVTSATTSASNVFTFSPPIKIKTPVSIQSPSCSSTFQPSCFSMSATSTVPIESTETTQPIKSWTHSFTRSSRNTFKNSSSKSTTPATHTPPEPFRIGQGTNTPPASSQSSLFSSKKRVQPETNISFPISKIPKLTSTLVTSATASSSDVFTFSPPIKIKTPVSVQSSSCSSEEQVQPKFTFSPAASITCHPPINSSSNTSSTTMTSSATTSCSIAVKTDILSKGSTSSAKKRVQPVINFSFPIPKIPKVTSTQVTSATTSSSDLFTFSHPIKIKTPVSIQSTNCSSKEIIKLEPNLPKFTFSPATSVARPPNISLTSKPVTFDTGTSTERFTRVTSNASSTLEVFNFSNPIMIKSPVLSQGSSLSSEEKVHPKFTFSPATSITRRPPINSSSNTSSTTMTSSATTSCSIAVKTDILSKGSTSSATFQPSCFSMPTSSTGFQFFLPSMNPFPF